VAAVLDAVGARRPPGPPAGPSGGGGAARRRFLTSGDPATFRALGSGFLGPEVDTVEAWRWS
jgi:hypothetical protein